jgi:hypothetical protein
LIFSPIRQRHYAIASIAIDAAMLRCCLPGDGASCRRRRRYAAAATLLAIYYAAIFDAAFAMLILLFHIFSMPILPLIADDDALLSFAVSAFRDIIFAIQLSPPAPLFSLR